MLAHRSCKGQAGGLYREGEQKNKMFCSLLWWLEIKKIYQNPKQFSSLRVRLVVCCHTGFILKRKARAKAVI